MVKLFIINNAVAFPLLTDGTANIDVKEQLSIGIRFIGTDFVVQEKCFEFVEIQILEG
jgi:hypothetical protein